MGFYNISLFLGIFIFYVYLATPHGDKWIYEVLLAH